jgi:hypothetical protein
MGQIFFQDSIPTLTKVSSTQVSLAASSFGQTTRITIGGQQYALSSALTLTTSTTGAGGLDSTPSSTQYTYVYAIVHATTGAVALLGSANQTPTIPSGYSSAYKKVGGFFYAGAVARIDEPATLLDIDSSGAAQILAYQMALPTLASPVLVNSTSYVQVWPAGSFLAGTTFVTMFNMGGIFSPPAGYSLRWQLVIYAKRNVAGSTLPGLRAQMTNGGTSNNIIFDEVVLSNTANGFFTTQTTIYSSGLINPNNQTGLSNENQAYLAIRKESAVGDMNITQGFLNFYWVKS